MRIRHRTSTERTTERGSRSATTELSTTNATTGAGTPARWRRGQRAWRVGLAALATLALAVATFALATPHAARAATTDITDCTYSALSGAISGAASGDTLRFDCNGVIYFDSAHGGGGTIAITKTLTISGIGHSVTLDGGGSVRLFSVQSGGDLMLDGLTITHGRGGYGGAVGNYAGTLTISNSAISGSSAGWGAGVLNWSNATITNSIITDNSTDGFDSNGAGVYNSGTLTITNSAITGNSATGYYGNGGGVDNAGTLIITNSTVSGNKAEGFDGGGGVFNSHALTITNSTFSGNSATGGGGGGVFNDDMTTIANSTFSGNSASGYVGGTGGSGSDGGGVENNVGGTMTITYSTFSGNVAIYGSGVYNSGDYPAGGTLTIANTIVVNNSTPSGARHNCGNFGYGTVNDGGYNLTNTTGDGCGFSTAKHDVITDTTLLGSLAYNGGPTKTIALLAGSPAIDQIPSGVNGCGTTIKTDQRGASRPQWGKCDIGAFEYVYGVKLLYNASKANQSGSAIPIKVQLTNTSGANVSAADITLTVTGVKNLTTGQVSPHSGVFKFEESSEQGPMYLFVLKTTGYATGSYALLFRATGDPMTHEALFAIR